MGLLTEIFSVGGFIAVNWVQVSGRWGWGQMYIRRHDRPCDWPPVMHHHDAAQRAPGTGPPPGNQARFICNNPVTRHTTDRRRRAESYY